MKEDVAKLLFLAEAADNERIPDGVNLPAEIARREGRLQAMAIARAKIEKCADERFEQEQADDQAKLGLREAKAKKSGRLPSRQTTHPTPPAGARDKDQINLADEE